MCVFSCPKAKRFSLSLGHLNFLESWDYDTKGSFKLKALSFMHDKMSIKLDMGITIYNLVGDCCI